MLTLHITPRWQKLYRSNPRDWQREDLESCTNPELEGLCKLLGIAHTGTKAQRITRMLNSLVVRVELASWPNVDSQDWQLNNTIVAELQKRYKRARLVELAKQSGSIHWLNKHGIITGLLAWREGCRQRGQEFDQAYRAALKMLPKQAKQLTMEV